jgi:hypothetical protein
MKQPIYVRPLTDAVRESLKAGLRSTDAFMLRRCQILLASDRGENAYPDSPRPGLQPANGAQRHPRVQREGSPRGTPAGIAPPAHRSSGLRSEGGRGFAGDASSGSPRIRQGYEPVDVGSRCRGELRGRLDDGASERGDHPGHSGAPRSALGAGQAVDNQPRPRVREKKGAATD